MSTICAFIRVIVLLRSSPTFKLSIASTTSDGNVAMLLLECNQFLEALIHGHDIKRRELWLLLYAKAIYMKVYIWVHEDRNVAIFAGVRNAALLPSLPMLCMRIEDIIQYGLWTVSPYNE